MEHQSAGGQLAPGFSALRLEFESLTIADHLRRGEQGIPSGYEEGSGRAGADGDSRAGTRAPTAAASLLALIEEAVGLEVDSLTFARGPTLHL